MHSVYNPNCLRRPAAGEELEFQLNWLLRENQLAELRERSFRDAREEEEMLLMRRPVAASEAYGYFGLLLGTLPPAVIFIKLFGPRFFALTIFMNVVCALAGGFFGSKLSRMASAAERDHWGLMLVEAVFIGCMWGAITGAAGGVIVFGIGAFFGAAIAACVGALAFLLFVPLHRLLARGGMIDARHLWPVAYGVVTLISALILGM